MTNLKLPDGTRVRFMLGLFGCGVMELGKGEAIVKDGRLELPFGSSREQWSPPSVDLFLKPDDGRGFTCDSSDKVLRLAHVSPTPGALVDASAAESTSMGCWLFDTDRMAR